MIAPDDLTARLVREAKAGRLDRYGAMIEAGASADAALLICAADGHAIGIHAAVWMGGQLDAVDAETGMTALHLAVVSASVEAVAEVLIASPDLEARDPWWRATPLHLAAALDRAAAAAALLDAGADPKARDRYGRTAAGIAWDCDSGRTLRLLPEIQ